MQGSWRRDPYAPHPLRHISAFVPAADCGEERDAPALLARLRSGLTPAAAAAAGLGPEQQAENEIVVRDELPPGLGESDVDIRAVWGLDRFTRKWVIRVDHIRDQRAISMIIG